MGSRKKEVIIVILDFNKATDTLEWLFNESCLTPFNFGNNYGALFVTSILLLISYTSVNRIVSLLFCRQNRKILQFCRSIFQLSLNEVATCLPIKHASLCFSLVLIYGIISNIQV